MGRSRYNITQNEKPHFLTFTVNHWIAVFTRPEMVQYIFDAWHYLQIQRNLRIYGYVILENHIHLVAQSDDLRRDIKSFKARTARVILDHLQARNARFLLKKLAFHKQQHKTRSQYQLWQEGSHPQLIISEAMLRQKLDYIHMNPVKRGYIVVPEHWRYSSAGVYLGQKSEFAVDVFTHW